ncbi:Trigger factor [Gossypium arboreum]|uniref:Trigger factor n=1 Tax=Gossypium arboreum TaxID=29729 RepID=A0A0B0NFY3_GOSAR|nr:Trigger factor [Gossypium arboreum]
MDGMILRVLRQPSMNTVLPNAGMVLDKALGLQVLSRPTVRVSYYLFLLVT